MGVAVVATMTRGVGMGVGVVATMTRGVGVGVVAIVPMGVTLGFSAPQARIIVRNPTSGAKSLK